MSLRFVTLDVFTDRAFAGNPLAVVLDGRELTTAQMQAIAREFNFSETTFVLPSRVPDAVRRVRIFTPTAELPFAGHPVVGTAIALLDGGHFPDAGDETSFAFDLDAGLTLVTIDTAAGRRVATFQAPQPPRLGTETRADLVAAAVGLPAEAVDVHVHAPIDVGTGVDYIAVRLTDAAMLRSASPKPEAWAALPSPAAEHGMALYVPGDAPDKLHVRMFAPGAGVLEDPATGSAATALGGLLATLDPRADARFAWTISQGVEMGRPSKIEVAVDKQVGIVAAIRVSGQAVRVTEGTLFL